MNAQRGMQKTGGTRGELKVPSPKRVDYAIARIA